MSFEINVPKRYDMLASIHAWIYPDIQPVPEQTTSTSFFRVIPFKIESVPVIIHQMSSGEPITVIHSSQEISEAKLKNKIIQFLGLDIDMTGALRKIRKDENLTHIYSSVIGILPYQSPSPFEALIKTIIQQQVSYRAANIFTKRMVLSIASKTSLNDVILYSFPTSEEIFNCGNDGLKTFGFGYKAEYVFGVAELVANGILDLENLIGRPHTKVLSILKPIRGIGMWTVRTLAIAGLGDFTTFPVGDLGIRNLMGCIFNNGKRMSTTDVVEHTKTWGKDWPLVLYLMMCADVLGLFGDEGRQQTHKRRSHK